VQQLAKQYAIPPDQVLVLDTSYIKLLTALNRQHPKTTKNHFQPLQASYYGRNGHLQTFYINCYAGGFPNLAWNASGGLNQFPPARKHRSIRP
jgi:hypothetical protein